METENKEQKNETVAILSAISELTNPELDSVNPHFRSKYSSLGCVLKHIRPVLKKYGVVAMQDVTTQNQTVSVATILAHAGSNGRITFGPLSLTHDGSPQKLGSLVTYLRRYSLLAACGICGDEDDDANSAMPTTSAERKEGKNVSGLPPAPEESRDVSDWRHARIHFGKHKDKELGSLDNQTIHWYQSTWAPKKAVDQKYPPKPDDIDLMNALNSWHAEIEEKKDNQEDAQDNLPM